ncbi:flagellar basal body P-ring formation chaperone FlgA [Methylocystis sp. IM3]|uniref:flagellar basal body P-ring formation chaperone FlgA n=1 Tax=unclassified Methylocystis TaxID=2625913 RepID=UPI0030F51169
MTLSRCLLAALLATGAGVAQAQESFPVARVTIYPGDAITKQMLDARVGAVAPESQGFYMRTREGLVGKVARRTLLPGQPIPVIAIDNPRLVAVGAQVKIVYAEGGLHIVAYGIAQQAGGVGDVIRIRNQDSGLFLSGRVQSDGSVRVGEG